MSVELAHAFPLIFAGVAGLLLLAVDMFSKERPALPELAAASALVTLALSVVVRVLFSSEAAAAPGSLGGVALSDHFVSDHAALVADLAIGISIVFAALLGGRYLRVHRIERGEYYALLLFAQIGAMVFARASSGLGFFVGLELMSLALYGLVAFRRTSVRSVEAGLKYFFAGSLAGAIGLFGFALLYVATGSLTFTGIAAGLGDSAPGGVEVSATVSVLGVAAVLAGVLFKLAVFPFHAWAPDTYEGAPTPAVLVAAVAVKASTVMVLLRLLVALGTDPFWQTGVKALPWALGLFAILALVIGNFGAFSQQNVKRMLAFSSIAHGGYLLAALAVAALVAMPEVLTILGWYVVAYALGLSLTLGGLMALGRTGAEPVHVGDVRGAFHLAPLPALAMALGLLTLLGMPLTPGFIGKLGLIIATFGLGSEGVWLAIAIVAGSVVSAGYYLPLTISLFRRAPETTGTPSANPTGPAGVPTLAFPRFSVSLVAAVALTAVAGILPFLFAKLL